MNKARSIKAVVFKYNQPIKITSQWICELFDVSELSLIIPSVDIVLTW